MSSKPNVVTSPIETDEDAPWPPPKVPPSILTRIELENLRRQTAEKNQGRADLEPSEEEVRH